MKKSTHALFAIRGIVLKTIAVLLIVCLLLPVSAFAASSTTKENGSSPVEEVYSSDDAEFERLMSERSKLETEKYHLDKNDEEAIKLLDEKLKENQIALEELGVEFLTFAEVLERFGDKCPEELLALEKSASLEESSDNLRVEVPESDINRWTSRTTRYTTGGITYELEILYATPLCDDSPLFEAGARITGDNNMHQADEYNVMDIDALGYAGGWEVLMPEQSFALTLFDAAGSAIFDFNEMTEVVGPNITYSWINKTTAAFTYVKPQGESDDYRMLALVSTKADITVNYQIPRFTYITSQGLEMISSGIIQGSETVTFLAPGYDSDALAVAAYTATVMGTTHHRYVDRIEIYAGITTPVATVQLLHLRYDDQCEW